MSKCPRCDAKIEKGSTVCQTCVPGTSHSFGPVIAFAVIFGLTVSWLGLTKYALPKLRTRRAIELVMGFERGKGDFLKKFEERARWSNVQILGWETQMLHPIVLVTYVYVDTPSTPTRKAFWWTVDLSKPKATSVQRLKSIDHFVDKYLLQTFLKGTPTLTRAIH